MLVILISSDNFLIILINLLRSKHVFTDQIIELNKSSVSSSLGYDKDKLDFE